jgi:hypothetical protein
MFTSGQHAQNRLETSDRDSGRARRGALPHGRTARPNGTNDPHDRPARHDTDLEEVTDMTALIDTTVTSVDELYALWDSLREDAISAADRQEIDDIFARQLP